MSFETALLAGIGSVTAALVIVCKILWADAIECKRDRADMHKTISAQNKELGEVKGMLIAFRSCPLENCPFPSKDRHPLSQIVRPPSKH